MSHTELFNTYLPPFQAAVDAGVDMIMPAFVAVDRVPCVCNEWLLGDVLRERMGFRGVTISDWGDVGQLMNHGIAQDLAEAAQYALQAGLDMDMMSFAYLKHLPQLVRDGKVSEDSYITLPAGKHQVCAVVTDTEGNTQYLYRNINVN